MKQYITKEQWEELDDKQKWKWLYFEMPKKILPYYYEGYDLRAIGHEMENYPISDAVASYPNIGQMIEFLGNDLEEMCQRAKWQVFIGEEDDFLSEKFELCDALWEAVKNKLK